jgi:hypothetical protein
VPIFPNTKILNVRGRGRKMTGYRYDLLLNISICKIGNYETKGEYPTNEKYPFLIKIEVIFKWHGGQN